MRHHSSRSAFLVALAGLATAAPTTMTEDTATAANAQNDKYCSIQLDKAPEGRFLPWRPRPVPPCP